MSSPLAAALTASLILASACDSHAQEPQRAAALPPPGPEDELVLIIARPEAGDLYLPPKVRIAGDEILRHNPELLRTNQIEPAYDLATAVHLAWQGMHPPNVPASAPPARRTVPLLSFVAAPAGALLLPLASLFLLCRRRTVPLGATRSPARPDRPSPGDARSPHETP